jgi:hypothetical protein
MRGLSPTNPFTRDAFAAQVRRRIWAPDVGFGRWRVGPIAIGISWPYSQNALDRFTLLGGRSSLVWAGNGDRKVEAVVTVLGCSVGVMVGSYYASLDLA